MIKISHEIAFDKRTGDRLAADMNGVLEDGVENWPVVYILSNEDEAYVGETTNIQTRLSQHLANPDRRKLNAVRIVSGNTFNKSVILDLEAYLISHMSADNRFKYLQNGNVGQQRHNYYQKELYNSQFEKVWQQLEELQLANKDARDIENSNLFKYSPYKSLTTDQYETCFEIVGALARDFADQHGSTFIVNGDPGTGKTILAIYLMKLLTTTLQNDVVNEDEESLVQNIEVIRSIKPNLKIGLVISMKNLRSTVQDVFRETHGLDKQVVLSPSEVVSEFIRTGEPFDILIVDEAHRLKTARNAGPDVGNIYNKNEGLGLDRIEGTQLDWVLKASRHQIFFYDAKQSIKRTDVDAEKFEELKANGNVREFTLKSQLRCGKEGKEYVDYIKAIFSNNPPEPRAFREYDVKLFDNVKVMTEAIIAKDQEKGVGLSRNLAGFAWPWNTKGLHFENKDEMDESIRRGEYDIEIDGYRYAWNSNKESEGWVASPNSVNEIGCIHTIQGFDLNYAGVIIGKELRYDWVTGQFYIDKNEYYDIMGKRGTDDADLLRYILNIYKVLCTRGMRGTYIYACDEGVRRYLEQFFGRSF